MVKARDIMRPEVTVVTSEMTVEDLGRLFMEKNISGAPVVDAGKLTGIVTENDLIKQDRRFHIPTIVRLFDAFIPLESASTVEKEIRRMSAAKVSDICTREVVSVDPETSLEDIATIMSDRGIHLIPVVSGEKLVGIIGKIDVIRGRMGEADQPLT